MPIKKVVGAVDGEGETPRRNALVKPRPKSANTSGIKLTGELAEVVATINKNKPKSAYVASHSGLAFGRLRTGVFLFDLAIGGGLSLSRVSMIYGEKHTGKSLLATFLIARAQRAAPDKACVYVDVEGTFDKEWAKKLGVDLDRLVIIEPSSGEEAVDQTDAVLRAEESALVVLDSIAMLIPMKEIEASAEDNLVGQQSRLVGRLVRKLNNAIISERKREHIPHVMLINQFRMKIGVMMGDPRTLPGGKALEYVTSQQAQMYNHEHIVDKGEFAGNVDYNEHEFRITKDKTGGRIKNGKFKLIRDKQITGLPEGYVDQAMTVIRYAERVGLATIAPGGHFTIKGHGSLRGEEQLRKYFLERQEAFDQLQESVITTYRDLWGIS